MNRLREMAIGLCIGATIAVLAIFVLALTGCRGMEIDLREGIVDMGELSSPCPPDCPPPDVTAGTTQP